MTDRNHDSWSKLQDDSNVAPTCEVCRFNAAPCNRSHDMLATLEKTGKILWIGEPIGGVAIVELIGQRLAATTTNPDYVSRELERCMTTGKKVTFAFCGVFSKRLYICRVYPVFSGDIAVMLQLTPACHAIRTMSRQQRRVCYHLGRGKSVQQIADRYGVSINTIATHIHRVRSILKMSREELTVWATRQLVPLSISDWDQYL